MKMMYLDIDACLLLPYLQYYIICNNLPATAAAADILYCRFNMSSKKTSVAFVVRNYANI